MTRRYLLSALLLAGVLAGGPAVAGCDDPRFGEYPAADSFTGKPSAPVLKKNTPGWNLRSRIREQAQDGPDFAGEWTIVSIGAGTGVQVNFLVNARTGRVVPAPQSSLGLVARLDSRLLVINDPEAVKEYGADVPDHAWPLFYVWEKEKFREVYCD